MANTESFKVGSYYRVNLDVENVSGAKAQYAKCRYISKDKKTAIFEVHGEDLECSLMKISEDGSEAATYEAALPSDGSHLSIMSSDFVSRIKEEREKVGLTRAALSRLAGIPIRTLENWEFGTRVPTEFVENSLLGIIKKNDSRGYSE